MARYYASSDSIYERREHLDVEHSKPVNVGQNAAVYRNIGSSFADCLRKLFIFINNYNKIH